LIFGGRIPTFPVPIEVKFCEAKRTHMPVSYAKSDMNRCNESPLLGKKPDFGLRVNLIPAVCCFAATLPVKSCLRNLLVLMVATTASMKH